MQLRWTEEAASDLERIADYLFEKAPSRELVLTPLQYVLIYRIEGEAIHVVRILHGAQNWPKAGTESPKAPIQ